MKRVLIAILLSPFALPAQGKSLDDLVFLCASPKGVRLAAPDWIAEPDAMSQLAFLVHYKGDKSTSQIATLRGQESVFDVAALGMEMRSGFSITSFGEEYIETYVYSAATSELLFSKTRAGSTALPNAIYSMKATCKPAGDLGRKIWSNKSSR